MKSFCRLQATLPNKVNPKNSRMGLLGFFFDKRSQADGYRGSDNVDTLSPETAGTPTRFYHDANNTAAPRGGLPQLFYY